MAAATYSFIDIVVLDDVRGRFAAADAMVILSTDLDRIIWANGAGAALLGFSDIEGAIGAAPGFGAAAKRQIAALPGFPAVRGSRQTMVRLAHGLSSTATMLTLTAIALPDDEPALLVSAELAHSASRDPAEIAGRAIAGLSAPGQFAALIDGNGKTVATSAGFDRLGLRDDALATILADNRQDGARLLKRRAPTHAAALPAGLARLRDTLPLYLLIVIDDQDGEADGSIVAESAPTHTTAAATETFDADASEAAPDGQADAAIVAGTLADAGEMVSPAAMDDAPAAIETEAAETVAVELAEPELAEPEVAPADTAENEPDRDAPKVPAADAPPPHDQWYFAAAEPDVPSDDAARSVPFDRAAGPVRFIWRTDANGRFSSISAEFAKAVGDRAADVVGRTFRDVARVFALDPDDEIAGLLERRDTWSGRSVLWPVAGTDLKVPVDLAALPGYGRDRTFEGFRGFGVVRTSDAVVDPEALGLALVEGAAPPATAVTPPATGVEPEAPKPPATRDEVIDPFRGEVPVLTIVPKQDRRVTDKIIRLAEHRPASNEKGLTPVERNAFREIGERLKTSSDAPVLKAVPATEPAGPDEPANADPAAETPTFASENPTEVTAAEAQAPGAKPVDATEAAKAEPPVLFAPSEPEKAEAASDAHGVTEEPEPAADAPQTVETSGPVEDSEPSASTVDQPIAGNAEQVAAHSAEPALEALSTETAEAGSKAAPVAIEPEPAEAPKVSAPEIAKAELTARPADRRSRSLLDFATDEADAAAPVLASGTPGIEMPEPRQSDAQADGAGGDATTAEASGPKASEPVEIPAAEAVTAEDVPPVADAVTVGPLAEAAASGAPDVDPASSVSTEPQPAASAALVANDAALAASSADVGHVPAAEAEAQTPPRPARVPPAIRTSGFLPSAFASSGRAESRQPVDTSILAQLPIPVLVHAGDVLHYANREFLTLTGYASVDDLSGAGGLDALFQDGASAGSRSAGERKLQVRTAQGEEFPVDAFLQSVPWDGGKALLLVLRRLEAPVPTETPDRGDFEGRIAEMRTIIDTATDGVVLIDNDATIRTVSRPAEALFGYDVSDLAGRPFASLFAIESQRGVRDYLNGLSDNGVASVLNDGREVIGRESQGRFIPLFMTIGRLPNKSGYCAVLRDITQWKRAEEDLTQARAQAERASTQKSDFLARISHEIRTPLNAIIGFSELMIDEKFGAISNDRYRDYLRDINRSGNHVLDLVNDLLDISKIEAGQQEMDYEAVALNDTLAETVAMMQPQANRERVIIRSSFASKLPDVVADLRSVRQIALNILSNAIRYTKAGGQVIVSTAYEPSGDVMLRVRDTGIGMTQAEIEQAMKPFRQINSLKRARGDGTGLGLPLTKAMVEANRARFSIHSTPGEGTLVEIAFPSTRVLAE